MNFIKGFTARVYCDASYYFSFFKESCGSPAQAQGGGQCTWQVLAHATTLCCFQVGHWMCSGSGAARVQPGCCRQMWKNAAASCSLQRQRRGEPLVLLTDHSVWWLVANININYSLFTQTNISHELHQLKDQLFVSADGSVAAIQRCQRSSQRQEGQTGDPLGCVSGYTPPHTGCVAAASPVAQCLVSHSPQSLVLLESISSLPLRVCEDQDTLNASREAGRGPRGELGLCLRILADLSFQAFWRWWSCLCLTRRSWCVRINRATLRSMPQRSTDTWTWSNICWGWRWRYGGSSHTHTPPWSLCLLYDRTVRRIHPWPLWFVHCVLL